MDKSEVIKLVCSALTHGDVSGATSRIQDDYPFEPVTNAGRRYTAVQSTRLFASDGFIDRYSGQRLIFPGTLRLLARLLPNEFPFHSNWKMTETHVAFWELFPTVDHVMPVARGGADDDSNWATTSMMRNSAKSNWTLEELGWRLVPAGDVAEWDGLMGWFVDYASTDKVCLEDAYLAKWHRAAVEVTAAGST